MDARFYEIFTVVLHAEWNTYVSYLSSKLLCVSFWYADGERGGFRWWLNKHTFETGKPKAPPKPNPRFKTEHVGKICIHLPVFYAFLGIFSFHFIFMRMTYMRNSYVFLKMARYQKALILKSGKILPIIAKQIQLNLSQSKCSLH